MDKMIWDSKGLKLNLLSVKLILKNDNIVKDLFPFLILFSPKYLYILVHHVLA